ncbi:hypothetical protein FGO68_gene2317 [Halteria grandinella]|uniref:Uncharacterized protein n=1 Tax=Halteria grandinella TaxID=5974 RepID=A0A8J8T619_HALGN|nr:hypothetical protein FGO68_gene2317 [Halteria grandinella]
MYRNNVEEEIFTLSFTQFLDKTIAARYSQEDYYQSNNIVQDQSKEFTLVNGTLKYFMAQRKDEITEYAERFRLRELKLAIRRKEKVEGSKVFKQDTIEEEEENGLYNYQTPQTLDEINENNKQRYPAKLIMREIAIFASVNQLTRRLPAFFTIMRALCPFVARAYEN